MKALASISIRSPRASAASRALGRSCACAAVDGLLSGPTILRRKISLIEVGAGGPMIVGRADDADVLRPEGFLGRNGHPRPAAELCALSSAGLRHKQAYASAGRDPGCA